jgi:hypothetical protein
MPLRKELLAAVKPCTNIARGNQRTTDDLVTVPMPIDLKDLK